VFANQTQTLSNKTIGSTGLTFSGASTDITTATNESLTIVADGAGEIVLNDTVQIPTLGANTGAVGICRNASNQISSCGTNPDSVTLQQAYDAGNAITSTDAKDIDFVFADTATDSNFDIDLVADNTVSISRIASASSESPAQLLLLENLDGDITVADGILFNSVNPGVITDAIDASDADIVNALNVGDNIILGTNAVIDFAEFDVAGGTGAVTINDDGDLGSLTVEGTVLDINSLDFAGAGTISSTGATLTLNSGNNTITFDASDTALSTSLSVVLHM
jgi:hypothetical protein